MTGHFTSYENRTDHELTTIQIARVATILVLSDPRQAKQSQLGGGMLRWGRTI
jgi:hypothetical protein